MGDMISSFVAQSGGGTSALVQMVLFLVPMLAIMYILMIRPERKKQEEHANFLGALKKGDEVVLNSGIIGKVLAVEERTLQLEIADKVKIRVLRVSVSGPATRYLATPAPTPALDEKKTDDKKTDDKKSA